MSTHPIKRTFVLHQGKYIPKQSIVPTPANPLKLDVKPATDSSTRLHISGVTSIHSTDLNESYRIPRLAAEGRSPDSKGIAKSGGSGNTPVLSVSVADLNYNEDIQPLNSPYFKQPAESLNIYSSAQNKNIQSPPTQSNKNVKPTLIDSFLGSPQQTVDHQYVPKSTHQVNSSNSDHFESRLVCSLNRQSQIRYKQYKGPQQVSPSNIRQSWSHKIKRWTTETDAKSIQTKNGIMIIDALGTQASSLHKRRVSGGEYEDTVYETVEDSQGREQLKQSKACLFMQSSRQPTESTADYAIRQREQLVAFLSARIVTLEDRNRNLMQKLKNNKKQMETQSKEHQRYQRDTEERLQCLNQQIRYLERVLEQRIPKAYKNAQTKKQENEKSKKAPVIELQKHDAIVEQLEQKNMRLEYQTEALEIRHLQMQEQIYRLQSQIQQQQQIKQTGQYIAELQEKLRQKDRLITELRTENLKQLLCLEEKMYKKQLQQFQYRHEQQKAQRATQEYFMQQLREINEQLDQKIQDNRTYKSRMMSLQKENDALAAQLLKTMKQSRLHNNKTLKRSKQADDSSDDPRPMSLKSVKKVDSAVQIALDSSSSKDQELGKLRSQNDQLRDELENYKQAYENGLEQDYGNKFSFHQQSEWPGDTPLKSSQDLDESRRKLIHVVKKSELSIQSSESNVQAKQKNEAEDVQIGLERIASQQELENGNTQLQKSHSESSNSSRSQDWEWIQARILQVQVFVLLIASIAAQVH